jgi:2-oxoglutarate ferredoxin oxidoreductase subunit gamma
MIKSGGTMFLNSDLITEAPAREDINVVRVPANSLAHEMGSDRSLNMVMLGAVRAATDIVSEKSISVAIETVLEGKKQKLIDTNQRAVSVGSDFMRKP